MKCLECGQRFTYEGALRYHMKQIHKKEMEYFCDFCGKKIINGTARSKYCSRQCQQTNARRVTSMRLGIPPARSATGKLDNPLYFS